MAFAGEAPGEDDPLLAFEPYKHKAPRRNSITPERQRGFVMALAASGIVTQAAREVGVSLEALYRLRAMPGAEAFAAAWEGARVAVGAPKTRAPPLSCPRVCVRT